MDMATCPGCLTAGALSSNLDNMTEMSKASDLIAGAVISDLDGRGPQGYGALEHCPPLEQLDALQLLAFTVEQRTRAAVKQARAGGATWAAIGAALGVTRSAVQQKYHDA